MRKLLFAVLCLLAVFGCSKEDEAPDVFSGYSKAEYKLIKALHNKWFMCGNYDYGTPAASYGFFCFSEPNVVEYYTGGYVETITLHGGLFFKRYWSSDDYDAYYFQIIHDESNSYTLRRFFVPKSKMGSFPIVDNVWHDVHIISTISVEIIDNYNIKIGDKIFSNY